MDQDITERIINHVPAGVRAVYDRHDFRDEKREGLERWANHIAGIIKMTKPTKVVPLRRWSFPRREC
jgi:hypothetical protein